jgi:hypothetical protein
MERNLRRWLALILLVTAACSLGDTETQTAAVRTSTYTAPRAPANTADLSITVPFQKAFISAQPDLDNLIEAEVEHVGDIVWNTEGNTVELAEDLNGRVYEGDRPLRWNVLLHPEPALDLAVNSATAEVTLDATGLNLNTLHLQAVSGTIDADLPATPAVLTTTLSVSSGTITLNLPDNALVDLNSVEVGSGQLHLNIGSAATVHLDSLTIGPGRVVVDVPVGAAVRLDVREVGAGRINLAYPMIRISGAAGDEGIWETEGFVNAEHQIWLVVDRVAAGSFELE